MVGGGAAYQEDGWAAVRFVLAERPPEPPAVLVSVGPCSRCRMVNIDQFTGRTTDLPRSRRPLYILSRYRRRRANILFGQLYVMSAPTEAAVGKKGGDGGARMWVGSRVEVIATREPEEFVS